jgi:hypothetical protein
MPRPCAKRRRAFAELLARRDVRIAERITARLLAIVAATADHLRVLHEQGASAEELKAVEAPAREAMAKLSAMPRMHMWLPVRPPGLTDSEDSERAQAAREFAAEQFRSVRVDRRRSNCPTARARRNLRARRPRGRRSRRTAGTRAGPSSDDGGEGEPAPRPAHDVGVARDRRRA